MFSFSHVTVVSDSKLLRKETKSVSGSLVYTSLIIETVTIVGGTTVIV